MSVQTEITRIESAKTAIATAIAGKGVTVPDGTLLDGMAALIESIEAGGGNFNFDEYTSFTKAKSGTYTVANDVKHIQISHKLGEIPKIVVVLPVYDSSVTRNYRGFGCIAAIIPSLDYYICSTFRVNGSSNFSSGTAIDFKPVSNIDESLPTSYGIKLTNYDIRFGSGSNVNEYYTILAGTTFHWFAMA